MKIALVVRNFPKQPYIVSKFLGLLRMGHDVHIVCDWSNPNAWARFPSLDPKFRSRVHARWQTTRPRWLVAPFLPLLLLRTWLVAPRSTGRYLRRGGGRHLYSLHVDALLLALQPEIIHFEFSAMARSRRPIMETLGAPTVVTFRGADLAYLGLTEPGFYDDIWRYATAIHVHGGDLWQRALQRGCPPEKRHALIPTAIEIEPYLELARELGGHPFRIVVVGRLHWKKGHEYVLEAIRLLVAERGVAVSAKIIGGGEFFDAVAFTRREYGLEEIVELVGPQPPAKVREALAWADAFALGSVSEGFSKAVTEAQAAGLPVVCTDAEGLPEIVVDGETGFVVPRRNAAAMADRLEQFARDPSLRARMGAAGRERSRTHFRQDDQIRRFDELYHELSVAIRDRPGRSWPRSTPTSGETPDR